MAFVEIQDIRVSYGAIEALKGISLSVEQGELYALIGANGAGKSTLLKALAGLEPLTAGTIHFNGERIATAEKGQKSIATNDLVARGISLVPEGRRVFADMSVEENLDMGAFLVRDKKVIKAKKDTMFGLFPILGQRRAQKAASLSGGEQQMLAIARALMCSPRLLLLDEPALGLAPLIIRLIFETITEINRSEGVTVLLVEQNARMALQASNRASVLETGVITLSAPSTALLEDPRVRAAYLGE